MDLHAVVILCTLFEVKPLETTLCASSPQANSIAHAEYVK